MFYLDQRSMLLITVLTRYLTSKPALNDLANVLNSPQILCLKNLEKSWSIRVKENFHEKKFQQFGYTSQGCPEFTFSKNWGICQVIKKGRKHTPVHFQAMPDLEKSRRLCIGCKNTASIFFWGSRQIMPPFVTTKSWIFLSTSASLCNENKCCNFRNNNNNNQNTTNSAYT